MILYKDRLIQFGYEMIEYLCEINDVEIEVIDNTEQSREQELAEDLIQIVTLFANQLYGLRSKKTKQLMDEVKKHVTSKENPIDTDSETGRTVLEKCRCGKMGI